MKLDPAWLTVLSELFVNLSAGWFGVVVVVPTTSKRSKRLNFWLLTGNLACATVALALAFKFKQLADL